MEKVKLTRSSGNVFRDLGFSGDEAEYLKVRAELMAHLLTARPALWRKLGVTPRETRAVPLRLRRRAVLIRPDVTIRISRRDPTHNKSLECTCNQPPRLRGGCVGCYFLPRFADLLFLFINGLCISSPSGSLGVRGSSPLSSTKSSRGLRHTP